MIEYQYFRSEYGELILGSYKDRLCLCDWRYRKMRKQIDRRISSELGSEYTESSSVIIKLTISRLEEYFAGERKVFDIPLLTTGTDFQKKVWKLLTEIPYGQTRTYTELAVKMENKEAVRAIASANGANAISIIIPCHRVVGSNGEMTGYAGGIEIKRRLLQLENPTRFPEQKNLFGY